MTFGPKLRGGVVGALALLAGGTTQAQPTLNPQGGGSIEMDHSRMGGPAQAPARDARSTAPDARPPTLNPQGGAGNSEMDHGRMGGANMGSPQGGRIVGNPGSGPEVEHGRSPGQDPTTRSRSRGN